MVFGSFPANGGGQKFQYGIHWANSKGKRANLVGLARFVSYNCLSDQNVYRRAN